MASPAKPAAASPPPAQLVGAKAVFQLHFVFGEGVQCLAASGSDLVLFAGCQDGSVYTLQLQGGKCGVLTRQKGACIRDLRLNQDETKLVVADQNKFASVWDARKHKSLGTSVRCDSPAFTACFAPDSESLLVGAGCGACRAVPVADKVEEQQILAQYGEFEGAVSCCLCSSTHLFVASVDPEVSVYSLEGGASVRKLGCGDSVCGLALHPNGTSLAACTWEGLVHEFDLSDLQASDEAQQQPSLAPKRTFISNTTMQLNQCAYTPCGRFLVAASDAGRVFQWGVSEGDACAPTPTVTYLGERGSCMSALAVVRDVVIGGDDGGRVHVWKNPHAAPAPIDVQEALRRNKKTPNVLE